MKKTFSQSLFFILSLLIMGFSSPLSADVGTDSELARSGSEEVIAGHLIDLLQEAQPIRTRIDEKSSASEKPEGEDDKNEAPSDWMTFFESLIR